MHIDLAIVYLRGELIMEGRSPHVIWDNLKIYIDNVVFVALHQGYI